MLLFTRTQKRICIYIGLHLCICLNKNNLNLYQYIAPFFKQSVLPLIARGRLRIGVSCRLLCRYCSCLYCENVSAKLQFDFGRFCEVLMLPDCVKCMFWRIQSDLIAEAFTNGTAVVFFHGFCWEVAANRSQPKGWIDVWFSNKC